MIHLEPTKSESLSLRNLLRGRDTVSLALRSSAGGSGTGSVARKAVADRSVGVFNDVFALLLLPGSGLDPLGVLPRAGVRQFAAAGALARPAELLREVLLGNLRQKFLLVPGAEDVDLGDSDRVEELLDHAEDGAEAPGCVDQVQLAHALGVVVLRDGRGFLDVAVNGANVGQTDALEVHDGARGFEEVTGHAGAGGEARVGDLFVFNDKVLEHAFFRGDFVHGGQVDLAELFDVEGAAVLQGRVSVSVPGFNLSRVKSHLVGLVVVLWVVLEDLLLL